ncbi:Di-copper centre-containing protein [Paraphaeosphaeria sporulosa]|uniref:Di-copper centre-containing protein n=1 Tax=Paraphaeosphaeria sporulosa TaxID=1460663 RepID=A0A177C4C2_9PLEO|nr:Di-copper centre-containing protein [Paraphaeosphaeria sporulosa]OAG02011.1 Di-copper centre-containing protein [Paraphaeosphaeria sporulosa]
MKISTFITVAVLSAVGGASPPPPPPGSHSPGGPLVVGSSSSAKTDTLAAQGARNLAKYLRANGNASATCTEHNVVVRREWSTFSPKERKEYIAAVQCLTTKPSKTPSSVAPGAKTRYDDFVATHINQTLSIHGTGNFLTWHRYFTWAYEQALRNECGYQGYQPYYNWPKWSDDPTKSPVLDGSDTSMSGDGAPLPGRNATCIPSNNLCQISLAPGNGGGCVQSGPFKNFTVNLGPVAPALGDVTPNPSPSGLDHNPRCLRRDISRLAASTWSTDDQVSTLITNFTDIASFSTRMQGDFPSGFLGVHTAGHFTVGGDPGGDLFASPGDPFFYFHHAMIDRVYWVWQNQDIEKRLYAVGNTITLNNMPPSRNATLEDQIDLGSVGVPVVTIGEASSTLAGPFCYVYA